MYVGSHLYICRIRMDEKQQQKQATLKSFHVVLVMSWVLSRVNRLQLSIIINDCLLVINI